MRKNYITWPGYVGLILLSVLLFMLLGNFDPDFESYRTIYNSGWRLSEPVFATLIDGFGGFLSYENFRYTLCAYFTFFLFKLAPRLGLMGDQPFGLIHVFALAPLVLLKFHVQIREGLALTLFLLAVTSNGGVMAKNVRSWTFWVSALVSGGLHNSVLMLWVAVIFIRSEKPNYGRQMFSIFILFSFFGAMTTNLMSTFIQENFHEIPFFVPATKFVSVDGRMLYWSIWVVFPALSLMWFNRATLSTNRTVWIPSIFGVLGTYGLLGFFLVAMLGNSVSSISAEDFNLTIRVAITLLVFLALQLAITQPRSILTWAIISASILIVARLIFFPQINPDSLFDLATSYCRPPLVSSDEKTISPQQA